MGTVPNLQLLRHADAFGFTVYVAAEVFNGPRLHDIPCVKTIGILFQILGLDLVCQRFLTGVDAEGQGIAVRDAALGVLNMNGYQIAACVLRRAVQRQVTAEGHVDAFHAAVGGGRRSLFGVRYDADGALAAIQTDLGLVIQFLPIIVSRLGALLHQGPVNRDCTVLVAGSAADAGTGNAVVILLSDDGRLEVALDLHNQLINVAGCGVGRNRCAAAFVNHQLERQVIVAIGGDGDNVAAFQNVCSGTAVSLLSECQNRCFGIVHIVPIMRTSPLMW